ncbi:glycosyltransferase [Sinorhizobium glycinis]|nr:glycosyltransferase [Sinorhizobium glycinis]
MSDIRVLNCITGLNVGGAEYMLARFARGLSGNRYRPSVLSLMTPGPVAESMALSEVDIQTIGMPQARPRLNSLWRLRQAIRTTEPALLHGWMYHGNIAASVGALMHRRQPVIWSIHHSVANIDAEKRMTRRLITLGARLSPWTAAISYCSRVAADQHEALGFDALKRHVIPNGIDCSEFQPLNGAKDRLHQLFNIPPTRSIIGNVARAHPMKDHAAFVKALAVLRDRGYDVHGLIIGDGHESGAARQTARDLGMDGRLTTSGARSDINALLPGLDVFMLSSSWGEAFPLCVAEAMACGVPAAATDVGDCAWLVGDLELISEPNNAVAQAEVVARLLSLCPADRRQLGMAARRRVIENFSLATYVARHLKLYEMALHRSASYRRDPWNR